MKTLFHACNHITHVSDDASDDVIATIEANNCSFCNARSLYKSASPKKLQRIAGAEMRNSRAKAPKVRVLQHVVLDEGW